MTLIELFPWLLAISVTLLSTAYLQRSGFSAVSPTIIGLALGIASWLTFVFGGKYAISWLEKKKLTKEKAERNSRKYRAFDPSKHYRPSKDLFYECLVCGGTIPSLPKRATSCTCRNVAVDADSGRVEVRDQSKVRLFSHAPA